MFIKFLSYIPAMAGVGIIGLFVLINNPKNLKNKTFFLLTSSISLWLLSLFLADLSTNETVALWVLRIALFMGAIMYFMFLLFAFVFPYRSRISRPAATLISLPILGMALTSLTSLVVPRVSIKEFGVQPEGIGLFYTISDLIGICYLLLGMLVLMYKYRHSNQEQRSQIKFVLLGLFIAIVANSVTGLVLTLLKIDTDLILLGSFSLFIFALFVAYAIVKHSLFDVRPLVARSVAYVLTTVMIGATFGVVAFSVIDTALAKIPNSILYQRIIYTVLAVMLVLVFQPTLRFFNRISNRIFYRDAYDPQAALAELNKILVGNIDLHPLLKMSSELIRDTFKTNYALFVVAEVSSARERLIGTKEDIDRASLDLIEAELPRTRDKVIEVNSLGDGHKKLKDVMSERGMGIAAKLTLSSGGDSKKGLMLVGEKLSGNPYSNEDVALMEIMVDELVIAIQNALRFEEIQAFTVTLQQKVDEATHKLRLTNEKLKALDETKDEFISMASHQLRTPLTSVKGYVSMVMEGDAGKITKQQHELLGQAFASSQRMVYLIADLLNVSRLRTGKFIIENKPTQLADVIESEIEQLKEAAQGKQQELTFIKPKSFPELMLDETKIRQVIMNFTDNALYYTPAGGHIRLSLEDKGQTVQFTVVDDGIGVPKEEQHRMFTKFYRAGNARKARPDGTGLGIFMAKKVIVAQGGAVIFQSEEGKGSTFGFSFSKSKLKVPANVKKSKATDSLLS